MVQEAVHRDVETVMERKDLCKVAPDTVNNNDKCLVASGSV